MKKRSKRQMSETFFLGALLALVGGFLDAYTYVLRGHVFANAQTGNIVLLALNLADRKLKEALYYLIPILAFALGIIIVEMVRTRFLEYPRVHWRQMILLAEIAVLICVAFLPQGNADMIANVAVSFICSIQVESFRKVNGNSFATTMCTGNLRSAMELLYHFCRSKEKIELNKSLQYFGIILFFIAGAALGYWLSGILQIKAVLVCCALLAIAFGAMFIKEEHPEADLPKSQNKN